MKLEQRIELMARLGHYLGSADEELNHCIEWAARENGWFTEDFIRASMQHIANQYLDEKKLKHFTQTLTELPIDRQKNIGVVMAGNIPLVGFHDALSVFLSGHILQAKLSTKDHVLMPFLLKKLISWAPEISERLQIKDMLKGCDAYIATGSSNSARYFEYYFSRFPHVIRRNRTSVAILTGNETDEELAALADDVYLYFGLGCRNVTQICVPQGYNFEKLLQAFRKYDALKDHNKYRNNYDYNLALYILNAQYYMSNESLLLIENDAVFSPISVLHYRYYQAVDEIHQAYKIHQDIQLMVGKDFVPFGKAQSPELSDFADGVNTMNFLSSL
jgi:hypothetical protein